MIVAFGSMEKEDSQAVCNMVALALAVTVLKRKRVVLIESGFGGRRVEEAVSGRQHNLIREPFPYMEGVGMDYLIKRSRYDFLSERTAGGGLVHVTDTLSYVPGVLRTNRGIYEEEFGRECHNILKQLDKLADYVFIDCGMVPEGLKYNIMEKADLMVLNVTQSGQILDEYFSFQPVCSEKLLYCIGNYIRDEPYNVKNIQRLYRIDERQIGVIPYNVEFLSSLKKGKAVSFFSSYPVRTRSYRNKDFFSELFKLADKVMRWEECDERQMVHEIYPAREEDGQYRKKKDTFIGGIDPARG